MQKDETNDVSRGSPRGEVRRLDLEVRHPAPRGVGREGARAADQRARELLRGADDPGAPARARHDVGVEEDDEVAAGRVPPRVPRAAREAPRAWRDDAGAALACRAAVASVEPSSTTTTSVGAGSWVASASSTRGSVRSAFRAGITTLYDTFTERTILAASATAEPGWEQGAPAAHGGL